MILARVRVKARSAGAMEMNGLVNREVDWGAEAPCVAWSAIFSLHSSALRVICLTVKLVIAPPSIIGWPAIDRRCTFSFQLNYITKKRIANVCEWCALFPASAKDSRLFLCNIAETCQAVLFKEIRAVVWRWQGLNQHRLWSRGISASRLVIQQWHLSDKCSALLNVPNNIQDADTSIDL